MQSNQSSSSSIRGLSQALELSNDKLQSSTQHEDIMRPAKRQRDKQMWKRRRPLKKSLHDFVLKPCGCKDLRCDEWVTLDVAIQARKAYVSERNWRLQMDVLRSLVDVKLSDACKPRFIWHIAKRLESVDGVKKRVCRVSFLTYAEHLSPMFDFLRQPILEQSLLPGKEPEILKILPLRWINFGRYENMSHIGEMWAKNSLHVSEPWLKIKVLKASRPSREQLPPLKPAYPDELKLSAIKMQALHSYTAQMPTKYHHLWPAPDSEAPRKCRSAQDVKRQANRMPGATVHHNGDPDDEQQQEPSVRVEFQMEGDILDDNE